MNNLTLFEKQIFDELNRLNELTRKGAFTSPTIAVKEFEKNVQRALDKWSEQNEG